MVEALPDNNSTVPGRRCCDCRLLLANKELLRAVRSTASPGNRTAGLSVAVSSSGSENGNFLTACKVILLVVLGSEGAVIDGGPVCGCCCI